jgi:hypothetical protein
MDDELQQLEAELKELRPQPPSTELAARIGRELAQPLAPRELAPVHRFWAVSLPAAAAVALVFTHFSRESQLPAHRQAGGRALAVAPLKPVTAENVLVAASDEGLVTLDDGTPARRERLQFVDTITWKNPRTNASLTWSVPREEIRVVPVSFQ